MRISCRVLGASGLGRKLATHGPLPETAAEFEPSDRMCQRRPARIVNPVDPTLVKELLNKVPEFRRAYTEDGLPAASL